MVCVQLVDRNAKARVPKTIDGLFMCRNPLFDGGIVGTFNNFLASPNTCNDNNLFLRNTKDRGK